MRWRNRLLTTRAMSRSRATAPSPSQNARYAEVNGTKTSIQRMGAKPSATTVTTCTPRKTSTNSETLRCTNSTTNRGHVGLLQRNDVRIPSSTLAVRNPSVTTPVARAMYHAVLPPESARTGFTGRYEPPERVCWRGGDVIGGAVCTGCADEPELEPEPVSPPFTEGAVAMGVFTEGVRPLPDDACSAKNNEKAAISATPTPASQRVV